MTFQVDITLGVETWSLTESHGTVSDGIYVLSGLDFGWSMSGGLWPRQPDAMTATLALTVPNFEDVTCEVGDWCAIEVKADDTGPVIARFYGDVTDYKVIARRGRPGVTVSVVAVDPTIRLAELQAGPYIDPSEPWIDPGMLEYDVMQGLWVGAGLSGGAPFDPALWTSPSDPDEPTGRRMGSLGATPLTVKVLDFTKALLDQAVNLGHGGSRMILAPDLSSDLTGSTYTLDTIETTVVESIELPASAVRLDSLNWSNVKGQSPGLVVVDSHGGGLAFEGQVTAAVLGSTSATYESLSVNSYTEAFAQDVADFYAGLVRLVELDVPGFLVFTPWRIDALTVTVTRADIGAEIPATLFPDWTDTDNTARAACYSAAVTVTDVDSTRTPDGATSIVGTLTGARCRIARGELEIDLTIRPTAEYE